MLNYIRIYRPINILFIAVAQLLSAYYLDFSGNLFSIYVGGILWLVLGTSACAAFGYWINDFLDQKRDSINKPDKMHLAKLPSSVVYIHLLFFVIVGLFAGYKLGLYYLLVFASVFILLFLYSKIFRNIAGLGNLIIAFLSFLSIYLVGKLFIEVDSLLLIHFAMLAGMVNLCREIIKDAEDLEGDLATKSYTFPVVLGLRYTNIAVYIILLFVISFMVISLYYQGRFLSKPLIYIYYAYNFLFVFLPLYKVAIDIRFAEHKADYSRLSRILKYVVFSGILSILFF